MKLVVNRGYNLETREESLNLFKYLRKGFGELGHSVVDCTPEKWSNSGDFLYKVAINANNMKGDLFLSIDLNIDKAKKGVIYIGEEDNKNFDRFRELRQYGFDIFFIKEMGNLYLFKNIKYDVVLLKFDITCKGEYIEKISKVIINSIIQ